MSGAIGLDMAPSLDPMDHSFTPSISPGQTSEHQDRSQPITITWAMYNEIMNRLEFTQTYAENLPIKPNDKRKTQRPAPAKNQKLPMHRTSTVAERSYSRS